MFHTTSLLTIEQIYNFLKVQEDNYIEKLNKEIIKYQVNLKDFFEPEEHLMYVSPISKFPEIIPNKYKKAKINQINVDKIVDEIFTNNMSDEINCRGVIFLNKCHVNELHIDDNIMTSYEKDKQFIKKLIQ